MIITDHNVKEALSIVEFGYIIYNGEIIKSEVQKILRQISCKNILRNNYN